MTRSEFHFLLCHLLLLLLHICSHFLSSFLFLLLSVFALSSSSSFIAIGTGLSHWALDKITPSRNCGRSLLPNKAKVVGWFFRTVIYISNGYPLWNRWSNRLAPMSILISDYGLLPHPTNSSLCQSCRMALR